MCFTGSVTQEADKGGSLESRLLAPASKTIPTNEKSKDMSYVLSLTSVLGYTEKK